MANNTCKIYLISQFPCRSLPGIQVNTIIVVVVYLEMEKEARPPRTSTQRLFISSPLLSPSDIPQSRHILRFVMRLTCLTHDRTHLYANGGN